MNSRQWIIKFVLAFLLFPTFVFAMPHYDTASHVRNFFNENKKFIKIEPKLGDFLSLRYEGHLGQYVLTAQNCEVYFSSRVANRFSLNRIFHPSWVGGVRLKSKLNNFECSVENKLGQKGDFFKSSEDAVTLLSRNYTDMLMAATKKKLRSSSDKKFIINHFEITSITRGENSYKLDARTVIRTDNHFQKQGEEYKTDEKYFLYEVRLLPNHRLLILSIR